MQKKTDNSNLAAKVELRRRALDLWHEGGKTADVFDACQGSGKIWASVNRKLRSYSGVDIKPASGRLAIKAKRLIGVVDANVFDIDSYGSPYAMYLALLNGAKRKEATVFTTNCAPLGGMAKTAKEAKAIMSSLLGENITRRLCNRMSTDIMLQQERILYGVAYKYGYRIERFLTCKLSDSTVKYTCIRLVAQEEVMK